MDKTILYQPHRPATKEKIFFLFSGLVVSAPFPFLVTSFLSYALMTNLPPFWAILLTVALIGPLVEEFAKAFPLFFRHGETEKSLMTLGLLVGLGFGITEFFFYVFLLGAPVFIRLPGLLFHAASTVIVAYGIGRNRSFIFYLLAVFLHLSYNFFALLGAYWVIGSMVILAVSYLLAGYFYQKGTERIIGEGHFIPTTSEN